MHLHGRHATVGSRSASTSVTFVHHSSSCTVAQHCRMLCQQYAAPLCSSHTCTAACALHPLTLSCALPYVCQQHPAAVLPPYLHSRLHTGLALPHSSPQLRECPLQCCCQCSLPGLQQLHQGAALGQGIYCLGTLRGLLQHTARPAGQDSAGPAHTETGQDLCTEYWVHDNMRDDDSQWCTCRACMESCGSTEQTARAEEIRRITPSRCFGSQHRLTVDLATSSGRKARARAHCQRDHTAHQHTHS